MATIKRYLYATADIHLFAEAVRVLHPPLRFPICQPVRFRSHPDESWSLWIVPEEPLYPCQWGRAKVALLVAEKAPDLLKEGERFDIWFGGEGFIQELHWAEEKVYQSIFHFQR